MISSEEFASRWSVLHSNASTSGIVGAWLRISYRFGLICTLLRISPNVLTIFGLLAAIGTAITALSPWAIILIVASLFFDGIDGSVAIFQHRENAWGALLDSVVDRISEALWLYSLYLVGVPAKIAIGIWLVAAIQEYARARAESLGVHEIGVVTLTERPVRASFIFVALLMFQLSIPGVTVLSIAFLVLHIFSAFQVMRFSYGQLR
ncbi:unannotated protein [freshwater metagenome]|uniref:Unannotated protein n=1 Tax=freshwater metagenome TaxID=449393 RepID=A0A6J7XZY0_9ZZZZ|nr:hypothetical protein [Actinomycetota bacterium]